MRAHVVAAGQKTVTFNVAASGVRAVHFACYQARSELSNAPYMSFQLVRTSIFAGFAGFVGFVGPIPTRWAARAAYLRQYARGLRKKLYDF